MPWSADLGACWRHHFEGHVWNVTGDCLDADTASLQITERWPIHRPAPKFDQLEAKTEMLEPASRCSICSPCM